MLILTLMTIIITVIAMENEQGAPTWDQIVNFKDKTEGPVGILTTSAGASVPYDEATNTLNLPLINNNFFMDITTHVNRERIPERINHPRGTGAFGYFEVTNDISHICKAEFLSKVGKKTPVAVRFSQSTSEKGTPDLVRDGRGFSIKFYTKEGNFDIAGLSIPVYFSKDPVAFSNLMHALRKNPVTNIIDPNTIWDILTMIPETLHSFIRIFSDIGIPASYRHMPGYGIHTFQLENECGVKHFVRFHIMPDCGIKTFTSDEAANIRAMDHDYLTRDFIQAIAIGDFPSWTVSVQILTESDIKKIGPKVFDVTRFIPLKEFPLHPVGKLVLNRNVKNFFAETEQLAFCPANLVPGILGAPDKLYESRRLSYRDAQFYRLGKNFNKITVNCPFQVRTFTYNRDGRPPVRDNEEDIPNYYPNSFHGPVPYMANPNSRLITIMEDKSDNFDQAAEYYCELNSEEQTRVIENILFSLRPVACKLVQIRAVKWFTIIHPDLGYRIARGLNITV